MHIVILNLTGRHLWLTLRYDAQRDVLRITLHPARPPMAPDIDHYEDLEHGLYQRFDRPEWSKSTTITFDDAELEPKPKRSMEDIERDGGVIRVFTLKLTNGAH